MLVNKATLTAVFVSIKTIFNKAFEGAASIWQETCMEVPSGTSVENYDWIDSFPRCGMDRRQDHPQAQGPRVHPEEQALRGHDRRQEG
jgi:phage major head subunit gpT-like protein